MSERLLRFCVAASFVLLIGVLAGIYTLDKRNAARAEEMESSLQTEFEDIHRNIDNTQEYIIELKNQN